MNGIDFLNVSLPGQLVVTFVNDLPISPALTQDNVIIEETASVQVNSVSTSGKTLTVNFTSSSDLSMDNSLYTFRLIKAPNQQESPDGFDPNYSLINFYFTKTLNDLLNGIDYLEVLDHDAPAGSPRQQTLLIHCFKTAPAVIFENVRIDGGERITPVKVAWGFQATQFSTAQPTVPPNNLVGPKEIDFFSNLPDKEKILVVRTNSPGDYSTYTLRLVDANDRNKPLAGFDLILSAVDFSFKVDCPSEFDCHTEQSCPPEPRPEIKIDYLAKDYTSFRQLMLDRLSVVDPDWKERNPADLGMALVELLAYKADHLSYQQDAIATEAYLSTARRRISVKRHARLVDYYMHDGCNARVWVQIQVNTGTFVGKGTRLLTRISGKESSPTLTDKEYEEAMALKPEVFETMHNVDLFEAHNEMQFYTWVNTECCLPKGATMATLQDDRNQRLLLRPGDILIFEEELGPDTGQEADADPKHRHAVRLTKVTPEVKLATVNDKVVRQPGAVLADPLTNQAIVEIEWADEDALPFALCLSSVTDAKHDNKHILNVSMAHGNIVLADHGRTLPEEPLGIVPESTLFHTAPISEHCAENNPVPIPPRFRPTLREAPLTHAATYDLQKPPSSAAAAMRWESRDLLPKIELNKKKDSWLPKRDLLNSWATDQKFVVEIESDGKAFLRFGDNRYGMRPNSDTEFTATYRVGNGTRGNVGAESIVHIVSNDSAIRAIRNPIPAQGGKEPESMEEVRQKAPSAFRVQQRAVTEDDYARVAERNPQVQRAVATFRWTGSWRTVFLTIDRLGGKEIDAPFKQEIRDHMDYYRMAGHDLEIEEPIYVSLEIEMSVCVHPEYFKSDIKAALIEAFSSRLLPDGERGFFHPDNFTFGQPVYLSSLYATAQAVQGITSVRVTTFQRRGRPGTKALADGILPMGRLEIARLDNDPNFPEHGSIKFTMEGGK